MARPTHIKAPKHPKMDHVRKARHSSKPKVDHATGARGGVHILKAHIAHARKHGAVPGHHGGRRHH
jgi:hypothetical protein